METVYRDYAPRGVKFYYIYKALAHPETNGYVSPLDQSERLMHVQEAERRLGSAIPWLCDTMTNDVKHALGDAPNSEFVIDAEGKVIARRAWSAPEQVRKDLEALVGPVEHPTQVSDLALNTIPPPREAASGIVPRLKLEGQFQPLQVTPSLSAEPFYVKLRAEADESLLRRGEGALYLGFLLDPLYHVHWNNLAEPLKYELEVPEGVTVEPIHGAAAKVEAEADIDPREFLIQVRTDRPLQEPLRVKVHYFACNDEAGWCKPVSQEYSVALQVDRDGGRVQARRAGQRPPAGRPGLAPEPRNGPPDTADQRFGRVQRIDVEARSAIVLLRDRSEVTVLIDEQTNLMRNGRPVRLDDLQPGDRVLMRLRESTGADQPLRAQRVQARSQ